MISFRTAGRLIASTTCLLAAPTARSRPLGGADQPVHRVSGAPRSPTWCWSARPVYPPLRQQTWSSGEALRHAGVSGSLLDTAAVRLPRVAAGAGLFAEARFDPVPVLRRARSCWPPRRQAAICRHSRSLTSNWQRWCYRRR